MLAWGILVFIAIASANESGDQWRQFLEFQAEYGKTYETSEEEMARFNVFKQVRRVDLDILSWHTRVLLAELHHLLRIIMVLIFLRVMSLFRHWRALPS